MSVIFLQHCDILVSTNKENLVDYSYQIIYYLLGKLFPWVWRATYFYKLINFLSNIL